jgi:hypothetical protein
MLLHIELASQEDKDKFFADLQSVIGGIIVEVMC